MYFDAATYRSVINLLNMKIFLDTADYEAIAERYKTGLVDGITTNPTLVRKSGVDYVEFIKTSSNQLCF